MKGFIIATIAICCLGMTTKAEPGIGHEGLHGVPDLQTFSGVKYPQYHLIDLGEHSSGHVPGDSIHETKHITVKEPQPYPVKIPVPHPYPVHVPKPYPVVQTKVVKVPQPVPYEIVKHVPVPVEVPKPYPVHGGGDLHHAGSENHLVQESAGYGDLWRLDSLESDAPLVAVADNGKRGLILGFSNATR